MRAIFGFWPFYRRVLDAAQFTLVVTAGALLRPLAPRPRLLYGVHLPEGEPEPRCALDGEPRAYPAFVLLYLYPEGRGWFIRPCPHARVEHLRWSAAGSSTRPFPPGPLPVTRGMLLHDTRTGVAMALFPGQAPAAAEIARAAAQASAPVGAGHSSHPERPIRTAASATQEAPR